MKSATRPRDREGDAEPAICGEVRRTHYARPLERTVDDIRRRVARALAAGEPRGQRERWRTQFHFGDDVETLARELQRGRRRQIGQRRDELGLG